MNHVNETTHHYLHHTKETSTHEDVEVLLRKICCISWSNRIAPTVWCSKITEVQHKFQCIPSLDKILLDILLEYAFISRTNISSTSDSNSSSNNNLIFEYLYYCVEVKLLNVEQ